MLQSIGKNLTANAANTIFTVPDGYHAIISMLMVINTTGNQHSYSSTWHDGSTVTIQGTKNLSANAYDLLFSVNNPLVLQEGDYITVTAAAGSSLSCLCTVDIIRNEKTPYNL